MRARLLSVLAIVAASFITLVGPQSAARAAQPIPAEEARPLKIVFAAADRDLLGNMVGLPQIYTVNEDGADLRQVTSDDGLYYDWPMWAMNGTKIVFTGRDEASGEVAIYLTDADGSNRIRLLSARSRMIQPRLSPDGRTLIFTASREEFPVVAMYRMDLATLQVENLSARFDAHMGLDIDPKWSPGGENIVFISGPVEDGVLREPQVYLMAADGTGRRPLTTDRYWYTDPSLSPDERYLASSSFRGAVNPYVVTRRGLFPFLADWHLVVRDTVTGEERVLTQGKHCAGRQLSEPACAPAEGPAWVPQWSPDGKRIAFVSTRSPLLVGIYVIDADGSNARPLIESANKVIMWYDWTEPGGSPPAALEPIGARTPTSRLLYGATRLRLPTTPDGNFILPDQDAAVEVSGVGLYASTPDGWETTPIAPRDPRLQPESARWTPDREGIVLTARTPVDATATPVATPGEERRVYVRVASSEGEQSAEARPGIAAEQIFLMDATGANVRQVTTPWTEDRMDALPEGDLRANTEPDVSPDGRYVVFSNVSSVTPESWILRMDLSTGEVMNLTSVTCGPVLCIDRHPRFSPDGGQIAFTTVTRGGTQVSVMDVDGGSVRRLTDGDWDHVEPAWSPDGRWLAFVRLQRTGEPLMGADEPPMAAEDPLMVSPSNHESFDKLRMSGGWSLVALNLETRERTVLVAESELPIWRPVWAPEGDRVAFLSADAVGQSDVYLVDAASQHLWPLATSTAQELFFDWR